MDLSRPLRSLMSASDADVLSVLIGDPEAMVTGRAIARRAGVAPTTALHALRRLVDAGLVTERRAGSGHLFSLNDEHLLVSAVQDIAGARQHLVRRLRAEIGAWRRGGVAPHAALLFGSVSRGDARPDSDIDLLIVRPRDVAGDADEWRGQLGALTADVHTWTGNDVRILELAERDLGSNLEVVRLAARDGVELMDGSRDILSGAGHR